jgi:DNA polymerase-1
VIGVANFVDNNFRIHPFTKLHGAVTGRISTEDPSVMNVTKKREGVVKRLYLPEDGHLIAELDAKTHELRCYCVVSGDEHLKEVILKSDKREGPDPHTLVAAEATKRRGKEVTRQQAKSGVFGRLYGRGKESFKYGYGLPEEDVEGLLWEVDNLFPTIPIYNKEVKTRIHRDGYLTSYFGRKRRFGLITDENKHELYRQGANFLVQSMASDINLYCMLHLYNLRDKLGIYPMFPVHDSIVMDIVDESVIPEVVKEWENYATELVERKMEFKAEVSVGPNWGDTKSWKGVK